LLNVNVNVFPLATKEDQLELVRWW